MGAWDEAMLAGALLLAVSGGAKLWRPGPTTTALRSAGFTRARPLAARALAMVEIATAAAVIVVGGRWSDAALAALYLGFSGFLLRALRRPASTCGCAGRDDTPPTVAHLVLTTMFAAAAVAAIAADGATTGLRRLTAGGSGHAVTGAALAVVTAWLGWSVLTLARTSGARSPGGRPAAAGQAIWTTFPVNSERR
jgi:hypothetical protein